MKTWTKRLLSLALLVVSSQPVEASRSNGFVYKTQATISVKAQFYPQFIEQLRKVIKPTRAQEGNILYDAYETLDQKTVIIDEIWHTKDHLQHHLDSPYMQEFFKKIKYGSKDSYIESISTDGRMVLKIVENANTLSLASKKKSSLFNRGLFAKVPKKCVQFEESVDQYVRDNPPQHYKMSKVGTKFVLENSRLYGQACVFSLEGYNECDVLREIKVDLNSKDIVSDQMIELRTGGWCDY